MPAICKCREENGYSYTCEPCAMKCKCGENGYSGKCGLCIMDELKPKPPRIIQKPNKDGSCNCLQNPKNGFKYIAHEMYNGKIVEVECRECDNTSELLVNLTKVKPDKLNKIEIVKYTSVPDMVYVRWCTKPCKTIRKVIG